MRQATSIAILISLSFILLFGLSCNHFNGTSENSAKTNHKALTHFITTAENDTIYGGSPFHINPEMVDSSLIEISKARTLFPVSSVKPPIGFDEINPFAEIRRNIITPEVIRFGENGYPKISTFSIDEESNAEYIQPQTSDALPFENEKYGLINYHQLGQDQGLTSPNINVVFHDSRGMYWFGGRRGLTRYDGLRMHYYPMTQNGQHRNVSAIEEDRHGNLWMTFGSNGGLVKFDGEFFHEYSEGKELHFGHKYLALLHRDREDNLWLKSEDHLVKFDGEHFTLFPYTFQDTKNLNIIMRETSDGRLFVSALGGICEISERKIIYYPIGEATKENLCHLVMEQDGGLLITTGDGVALWKPQEVVFYHSDFISSHILRENLKYESAFYISSDEHNALCKISNGKLQVSTADDQLFPQGYPMHVDEYGYVWGSSEGTGILKYNPGGFVNYDLSEMLGNPNMAAVAEGKDGIIWMGSYGNGLIRYDGYQFHHYALLGAKRIVIRSLLVENDGTIWAGTLEHGVFKIEPQKDEGIKVTQIKLFPGFSFDVFAFTVDRLGNLWIGSPTHGIFKYDRKHIFYFPITLPDRNTPFVRAMITDQSGNVWIGAQNAGLLKYDGSDFTYISSDQGLSSNRVVSLAQSSEGVMWAGTDDSGVNLVKDHKIKSYNTTNGLSSNSIWSIIEDSEKNIWLGANDCLNILHEDDELGLIVKSYCELESMRGSEFYANAAILDSRNRLWWGSEKSAILLSHPDKTAAFGNVNLYLDDIEINQSKIDYLAVMDSAANDQPYFIGFNRKQDISGLDIQGISPFSNRPIYLELDHSLNDLSFVYSATGALYPHNLKFSYKLIGAETEWSTAVSSSTANYKNLSPGTYTMFARVTDGSGYWQSDFIYLFRIKPPWYAAWWAIVLWSAMSILILVMVYQQISKRRADREEIKRIKEIDALKNKLYTSITHEFRTPLTLIMAAAEELEEAQRERELILRNSKKLLYQVNQLLDSAKLQAGAATLNLQQGDIIHYLQYLTASFHATARQKEIVLHFIPHTVGLQMDFDEDKIQKVIYNLLSNAIKFTPNRGSITMFSSLTNRNGKNELLIQVKDTGEGIPKKDLNRVFDRFYQASSHQSSTVMGSGIGLAFTKELVELMNGEITVQSELNQGSTFSIFLPITNKAQKAIATSYKPVDDLSLSTSELVDFTNSADLESASSNEKTILIAEDHHELQSFIKGILARKGYTVLTASNGREALEIAREHIPDAIISDVAMPEMDGWEFCQKVKTDERTSHIPVILLTAKVAYTDKIKSFEYGADAYITKPFEKQELLIRLEKLIETREKLQELYGGLQSYEKKETALDNIEHAFIYKLKTLIEEQLSNGDFGPAELAESVELNQMQLYRKLKALTGQTPVQFVRVLRLQKAMDLLKNSDKNISEIAYSIGFSDPNYFSRMFHKEFGNPPGHYKK